MEQERVLALTFQGIDDLHVTGGTQRGGNDSLSLTTGEQGGTVNGRQYANFHLDRANGLVVTAIDTRLAFDNLQTNDRLLDLAEVLLHFLFGRLAFFFTGQFFNGSRFDLTQTLVTGHLVANRVGFFDGTTELGLDGVQQLSVFRLGLPFPARLAVLGSKFLDGSDRSLHFLVAEQYGAQHLVLCQAFGLGLNHQHRFVGTGHNHVQQGSAELFEGRVQEVAFLVGVTHTGSTNRAVERDTGDGQGCRCSNHGSDIRIVVLAGRHNRQHNLNFVHVAVREQRANRTVDQAGGQGLFLGRTTFTLEEATRDFTGGVGFFLVVHSQGEEALARLGLFGANNGAQNGSVAGAYQYRAGCLTGNTTGFQGEGFPTHFKCLDTWLQFHNKLLHFQRF